MMVTDGNSPAQSTVRERQEISGTESEGQRRTEKQKNERHPTDRNE